MWNIETVDDDKCEGQMNSYGYIESSEGQTSMLELRDWTRRRNGHGGGYPRILINVKGYGGQT